MIVWTTVFTVIMAVLTFLDLPIAKSVYHYSDLYGYIFQIVGIIPTCVAGTFFAVGNLCTTRKIARKQIASAVLSVISIVVFVGFTLLSISHLDRSLLVPMILFSAGVILVSMCEPPLMKEEGAEKNYNQELMEMHY